MTRPTADARDQWVQDNLPRDPVEDFHAALTSEPDPEPVGAPMLGVVLLMLALLGMLLAASWLFYASPAAAQTARAPAASVVGHLAARFGEAPVLHGQTNAGTLALLWNPATGTFTALIITPDGQACMLAAGEALTILPLEPQGELN